MNTLHIFILLSVKNPQKMIKQVHIVTFARIGIATHDLQIYVSLPAGISVSTIDHFPSIGSQYFGKLKSCI